MMLPAGPHKTFHFARIMGAQLWYHEAPWHPDAAHSLKALQQQFLAENYDLQKVLPEQLANPRASVEYAKEDGDPYGLVDSYQKQVALLEKLSAQPIPENPEEQIELIRRIAYSSGDEIGNVLVSRAFPTSATPSRRSGYATTTCCVSWEPLSRPSRLRGKRWATSIPS